MRSKNSGIGWLLVFGMGMMGLAGMPEDPSAPAKAPVVQQSVRPSPSASEPPAMTCDGDACWWTDLGRPAK